jgi:Spy/CpxP family protein refolding chaperone
MRIVVALAALLATLVVWSFTAAQEPKQPDPPKKDDPAPPLKGTLPPHYKALGLDDKQKQAVYKLQSDYHTKIDALTKQIADLKTELKTEEYKLLTPAQKDRLKEILAKEPIPVTPPPVKEPPPPKDK